MYTLVMFIFLNGANDTWQIVNYPGFSSQATCQTAGQALQAGMVWNNPGNLIVTRFACPLVD